MGKSKQEQISEFSLEGRFLSFVVEDGYKIKRLRLATATGEYAVKLSKESRASVGHTLKPGDWIQVTGEQKLDLTTGNLKLKAARIQQTAPKLSVAAPVNPRAIAPKSSVLVCQKSDCLKRGGKAVCHALQSALSDRGLADQVEIKGTGCLKQCKAGPNIVFMPNKTRYSRVNAQDIPVLVDEHFPGATRLEKPEQHLVHSHG
ncbi:MAG: (2Fe-2S) ferredoxin domain-containing protein [Leptolyngbyaceae bacterium]|nr:(2Fe-2S) ferredoxin domain-containing protein [Leptolyngbyaceae bacterium]